MLNEPTTEIIQDDAETHGGDGVSGRFYRQAFYKTRQVIGTPLGRRMLQSGSVVVLGLAGVAAVSAVAAFAIQRYAGAAPVGVVQGSPLSPLIANVYLHPFDQWMCKRGHRLVRYADDFVVMAADEEEAERSYNDSMLGLSKLRLRVNKRKMRIVKPGERCEFWVWSFRGRMNGEG